MVRDAILVFGVIFSLCVGAVLFSGDITGMQTAGYCGDGVVDAGESCDDGNILAGDGCSLSCQTDVLTPTFQERTSEVDIPAYALDTVVARVVDVVGQGDVRIVEKTVPPRIAATFKRPVYRSFEANVISGSVTRVVFEFKVTKEWLFKKEVYPDAVVLYRYTSQWDALDAVMVDEDDFFFYYHAETPGLSYFIVSIKNAPNGEAIVTPQEEAPTGSDDAGITLPGSQPPAIVNEPARPQVTTRSPTSGAQTNLLSSLLTLAILAIVTGGALILFRRPRLVRKTRATSVDLDETLDAFERDVDAHDVSAAKHHVARMERLLEDASAPIRSAYAPRVQNAFTRLGKL